MTLIQQYFALAYFFVSSISIVGIVWHLASERSRIERKKERIRSVNSICSPGKMRVYNIPATTGPHVIRGFPILSQVLGASVKEDEILLHVAASHRRKHREAVIIYVVQDDGGIPNEASRYVASIRHKGRRLHVFDGTRC